MEQEEVIRAAKLDYETAQAELQRIQTENEAAKEEVCLFFYLCL
jgi:hypothetical protein